MLKFINPALVMAQVDLQPGQVVADLGCGNGFYVLPAAQLVGNTGVVYAVDVVESKLAATMSIASQFGYKNVKIIKADLAKPFLEITDNFCDLAVIGNILHEISNPQSLLKNVYRILKAHGKVMVVEWKKQLTPFGPPMAKRIDQQQLEIMLMSVGFRKERELQADGYHYAVLFRKQ